MVTFTTDYWAPALDVTVRRRLTPAEERGSRRVRERVASKSVPKNDISENDASDVPVDTKNGVRSSSVSDSTFTISRARVSSPLPVVGGPNAVLPTDKTTSGTENATTEIKTSNEEIDTAGVGVLVHDSANVTEPKKLSLVQRLFHPQSLSPTSSPLNSPSTEKDDFVLDSTADTKSMLRELLSLKGEPGSAKSEHGQETGSDGIKLIAPESLMKKYGVCEKGCIGKGATAVVRLAHKFDQADCERMYAVKEFRKRKKNESEKEYVKKLTSEFCISSTLQHVNVVRTVDLVQDENHNWCEVMEYCAGGDLYTAIKAGHMTSTEISCCFKQLVQGVGYLHSMGVAHRDIKPENLLLDIKGHLKITDFGVSDVFRTCWEDAAHMSRGLCGSEPYIAPEQFETKEYDARLVDVWACGIVHYVMLYQGIPFRIAVPSDPNFSHYLDTRHRHAYEPIDRLPKGCRDLMYGILEPDPKKRLNIKQIMDDSWFKSIEVCTDPNVPTRFKHNHIPPEILKEAQAAKNKSG